MAKKIVAIFLGVISFFLMLEVGESFGAPVGFLTIGVFYLVSQFFLSRGNARALPEDWPLLLSLNAVLIVTAILILIIEPDAKWTAIVAVVSILCSAIGAGLAGLLAKKQIHH